MNARWEDLATRARGLATHLLRRAELDALAFAPSLDALVEAFRSHGLLPADAEATPDTLEHAIRRMAGERLRLLERWADARNALLAVMFGDEDRRSVRALVRGALQHAAPEDRLIGLIPTRALPEGALAELAAQPGVSTIATLLTAWGHEYGSELLPYATATEPDLLALEYRINTAYAAHALRGARAAHDSDLFAYVQETIDLENACAALILATSESDAPAKDAFVPGGRLVTLPAFLDAVATRQADAAGQVLAAALRPAALAAVFERGGHEPQAIEAALLRYRIAAQRAAARRDPAGAPSVLHFALRVRAEALDLGRVIWGVMLDAPRGDIAGALVSA